MVEARAVKKTLKISSPRQLYNVRPPSYKLVYKPQ